MQNTTRFRFLVATTTATRDQVIAKVIKLDELSIVTKNENPCTFITTTALRSGIIEDIPGVAHVIAMMGQ